MRNSRDKTSDEGAGERAFAGVFFSRELPAESALGDASPGVSVRGALPFRQVAAAVFVNDGRTFLASGFSGSRTTPDFEKGFKTQAKRDAYLFRWFLQIEAQEGFGRRSGRRKRELAHRDVLYSVWGFDAVSVDCYQVTARLARGAVEMRELDECPVRTAALRRVTSSVVGKVIRAPVLPYVMDEIAPGVKIGRPSCLAAELVM